jgi:type I restriction enzyme S subunit
MSNSEWKEYEMSELIEEISMGPFGSNIKVECFTDSGVPVLNGSNLVGFRLNEDSFNYVTEEKATSLGKANAYRGDIVITHRGTLGQIVYIPQNSKYSRYVISQSQFRVRCNEKVIPEYLVYYFHSRLGQHKLLSNASQVGVPSLARPTSTFQKLTISIPPVAKQKEIVKILSSLDDKIELNNAINRNLAA